MTYQEYQRNREKNANDYKDIFFAFNDDQFNEGMEKLGLEPTDTDKIYSIGHGGFILKATSNQFHTSFKNNHTELQELLKDDDFLLSALQYELCNHEYCITYELDDTLDVLGITRDDIKNRPNGVKILQKAASYALRAC